MNPVNRHEKNINPATVLIAATLLLLCGIALISRIQKLNSEQDWDVLIFAQVWPNTVCMEWEEKGYNCSLPEQKSHWTIHGIWPTKFGTKGPLFCGKTPFDINALDSIRDKLDEEWTDIEQGGSHKTNSFWKHEWLKHGTCASSLESLNSELKYFQQALNWWKDYNMIDVLGFKGVRPQKMGHVFTLANITDAVNAAIGRNPYIKCDHDTKTGLQFLSEIRICFDKSLVLVDCDGIKMSRNPRFSDTSVLSNCPKDQVIVYPKDIPPRNRELLSAKPEHYLVNLYKVLTFLNWFTS